MDKKFLFIVSVPRQKKIKKFWNAKEYKDKFDVIDQYELKDINLLDYQGIISSMHIDQYILQNLKDKIEDFLCEGRKFLFNGHIIKPFIKDMQSYIPMENPNMHDFKTKEINKHMIFEGFNIDTLNLRKGVAGFFGRGGNPILENSKTILAFKDGEIPCDWQYKTKDGGYLYVHSGNDLWMCFEDDEDGMKIFSNIVKWMEN